MVNPPLKRLIFIPSTVALVFAALFAESFVLKHLDHDCGGGHCATCLQIQIIRSFLDSLRRTGAGVLFPSLILINGAVTRWAPSGFFPSTLVLLKVKSST